MVNAQKKFAVFCWTHHGIDRERLTNDTPIDEVCRLSVTIRAQYEAAKAKASNERGAIEKVFVFEEMAHQPSRKAILIIFEAIEWCRRNGATLLVADLGKYANRDFAIYQAFSKYFTQKTKDVAMLYWVPEDIGCLPNGHGETLRSYFKTRYQLEKRLRCAERKKRIEARQEAEAKAHFNAIVERRAEGVRRVVKDGAKIGFGSPKWKERNAISTKGIVAQKIKAASHAEPILTAVHVKFPDVCAFTYQMASDFLNEAMNENSSLCPPRADRWNADSVRAYFNRHDDKGG